MQLSKNVVNGSEPMLRLIGDLPSGTPVAFEAAFGWSWLVQLLEDYGFDAHLVHPLRCKAIASARLKKTGSTPPSWRSCSARTCSRKRGSPRRRCGSSARCCGTGPAWSASAPSSRNRIHAVAANHGYDRSASYSASQPDAAGWPSWTCPPRRGRSSPTAWR